MADRSDIGLLRALLPSMRGDRFLYALAILMAPGSALVVVLQPLILQRAIDDGIHANDPNTLFTLSLAYLIAVLVSFLLETGYLLSISYAASRTIARLRLTVYRHTLSLPRSFFDREPTGRLLTRVTADVDALGETLTAGAITIVLDVLLVFGVLAAMFWLDPRLTAVLLLVAPPLALVVNVLRKRLRVLFQAIRTSLATLNAYTAERLEGLEVVQLYSDEERTLAAYDARLHVYRDNTIRTNVWDALLFALVDGLTSICMALMLWYGSGELVQGAVTAGLLAAFIDYVAKLFRPIQEFSQKLAVLQRASSALEKIFGLLDVPAERDDGTATPPPGPLVLEDVSFGYSEGNDVLRDISLSIEPGEVVALVGRTGSGKTTIGKLLSGGYRGWRGTIHLSGVPLTSIARGHLRRNIGTVPQDLDLFPGTVRFNLTLGKHVDDEVLMEAVETARARTTVDRLGGLDGHVVHGGSNMSIGEAQLLSFARALVQDSPFVILDEATASVDTLTEAKIQEATAALLASKTVLVIAHRLSTITGADRIVVLDAGRIVEVGDHASLIASNGAYASLFREQFSEHAS